MVHMINRARVLNSWYPCHATLKPHPPALVKNYQCMTPLPASASSVKSTRPLELHRSKRAIAFIRDPIIAVNLSFFEYIFRLRDFLCLWYIRLRRNRNL